MGNLFAELKRRHIYRVAAAYAVVAWIVLQIVNNVAPGLNLPNSAVSLVIVLLAAGFPIALIFAWVLALNAPDAPSKSGASDWVLAAVAIAFIGMFAYQQLAPLRVTVTTAPQTGVEAARTAAVSPAGTISLAVLPFANLSGDASQDFFSDGMTEEITSALTKIPDLRVVGRTSAFEFKGKNQDLRSIGQALSATHLLEGSVRKDGTRLRITAQLIKADDGVHVWTESYDRELTGVFAIQEDIATAIAGALRMPLGLKPGERLIANRANDPETYQQYLRAKTLIRSRGGNSTAISDAIKLLEQAVLRDPDFAPAWGFLGTAYRLVPRFDPVRQSGNVEKARPIVEATLAKAEAAAQRALRLDPKNSDGLQSMSDVLRMRRNYVASVDLTLQALAQDPDNPDVLNAYSTMLAALGHVKEALPVRQHLQALEPLVPLFKGNFATILWIDGQTETALALRSGGGGGVMSVIIPASQGRYGEAADRLQSFRTDDALLSVQRDAAASLLRTAPAAPASPELLPKLGLFGFAYLYVGAPERVLEYHEGNVEIGYVASMELAQLWAPTYAPLRKTGRFKKFVRDAGFVDYWMQKGWPDLCRPMGADDFVCD